MYSPEEQATLANARARLAAGGLTKAEEEAILTQAVAILRQARKAAAQGAAKKRAAKEAPNVDALLGELGV